MKTPIPISLSVEDDLSEWMLRRLLEHRSVAYAIGPVFKRGGFGYLRKQTPAFNNMAKVCPILLLTDLDRHLCASELICEWLPHPRHHDFLLRVAVREVEAWLLGSSQALGDYLGLRRLPRLDTPEALEDPKRKLLRLCAESPRRELRAALVREDADGNVHQGPAYNSTLSEFVVRHWQLNVAARACPSLSRTLKALAALETSWKERER